MKAVVKLAKDGPIAFVTVDNPPVNALSVAVRSELRRAFEDIANDPGVAGVVLRCDGRTFSVGADINEFDAPDSPPALNDVIKLIEDCGKPVVAAIHGSALGGGLEVALGCNFRVAVGDAKLGLPEVKLGLLPGAGGTQRLPRAVGPEAALKIIVSGEPISAQEGLSIGLIDAIVEEQSSGAKAFLIKALHEGRGLFKLREDDSKLASAKLDRSAFTSALEATLGRLRAFEAPAEAASAVALSLDLPFDEAVRRERASFERLKTGEQSAAQRHAFFAQRAANKIPGVPKETTAREVNRIAIIGAGTMGGGIAMSCANAGIPVTLVEVDQGRLDHGLSVMRKNWEATAARGGISKDAPAERMALINGSTDLAAIDDADLVIEAVFETMAIKKELFARITKLARPGAVLASNTSFLNINEIASVTDRAQDVLGMHFFSPANVMKLCEVVRGDSTAADVLMTAVGVARRIGKIPVVVGVCDGFVGNRMLMKRQHQAESLIYEGVRPEDIDLVATRLGMPMGPFAMDDLAGLDIGWRSRQDRGEKSEIPDALCEAGRFGQKSGAGYYRYEQGSRTPLPDPEVGRLIDDTLKRLGRSPRRADDQEILERLFYPMVNEGARILEEGVAARASDIDLIWIHGYGWPVYRGGPMHWAERIGLGKVVERLEHYAGVLADPAFQPAPLLRRLAAQNARFADLDKAGA